MQSNADSYPEGFPEGFIEFLRDDVRQHFSLIGNKYQRAEKQGDADVAQIYANKFWLIVNLSMEAFNEQAR